MKRTVELTPVILVDTYPSSMLHFIRRRRGVFLIVVLAVASILVFAFGVRPFGGQVGVSTHYLHFGSSGREHSGWLMPADTLISTSHTANGTLSVFITANLVVFLYQIPQGTILYVSLYLNGALTATKQYNLTAYDGTTTVQGTDQNGAMNFSNPIPDLLGVGLSLSTTYPAGTEVTLLSWASNPLWVQIDNASLTHSYEISEQTSYAPPSSLTEPGSVAPFILSVKVESYAQ